MRIVSRGQLSVGKDKDGMGWDGMALDDDDDDMNE